jgi:hypothetical protein
MIRLLIGLIFLLSCSKGWKRSNSFEIKDFCNTKSTLVLPNYGYGKIKPLVRKNTTLFMDQCGMSLFRSKYAYIAQKCPSEYLLISKNKLNDESFLLDFHKEDSLLFKKHIEYSKDKCGNIKIAKSENPQILQARIELLIKKYENGKIDSLFIVKYQKINNNNSDTTFFITQLENHMNTASFIRWIE